MGLYQSLMAQGKNEEATRIKNEFAAAWKDADIAIDDSVL
jgi:hypothetical protein